MSTFWRDDTQQIKERRETKDRKAEVWNSPTANFQTFPIQRATQRYIYVIEMLIFSRMEWKKRDIYTASEGREAFILIPVEKTFFILRG